MSEIVRIPEERVKILIGRDGKTKKRIEEKCNVELDIDSEGGVQISGDPSDVFFAMDVVKAIGRGFEPRIALLLRKDDYGLYIISLKEIAHSDKTLTRLKGRVIGEKGKIREQIESSVDAKLCIHGNTIGIIAKIDTMEYAKEAVNMLLTGAKHTGVLNYLAKAKRGIMQERLKG
ncbi:RNA-processing protein [Candidatus Micrarchaeota archaeon]|nr:RNA-processing protein [Candidatus Micrarchaeota archaeon]